MGIGTGRILYLPSAGNGRGRVQELLHSHPSVCPFSYFHYATCACTSIKGVGHGTSETASSLSYQVPPCLFYIIFNLCVLTCLLILSILPIRLLNSFTTKIFSNQNKVLFLHCLAQSHNVPSSFLNHHTAPRQFISATKSYAHNRDHERNVNRFNI